MTDTDELTALAAVFDAVLALPLPDPDAELIASGLLDSMAIVALVVEIEETFGIEIAPEDLDLPSFSTVRSMLDMVRRTRSAGR